MSKVQGVIWRFWGTVLLCFCAHIVLTVVWNVRASAPAAGHVLWHQGRLRHVLEGAELRQSINQLRVCSSYTRLCQLAGTPTRTGPQPCRTLTGKERQHFAADCNHFLGGLQRANAEEENE